MSRPDDTDRALAATFSAYVRTDGAEKEALGLKLDELTSAPRRYIGSTDVAAIVAAERPALAHLAKWKNVSDVFMRLVHGIDMPRKRSLQRGLTEEKPLLRAYRQYIGACSGPPGLLIHPRMLYAGGSPDALGDGHLVELKTASVWSEKQWGLPGTDQVPSKYSIQCQWLMGLTQKPKCHLLCGFGSDTEDADGAEMFAWTETRLFVLSFDAELYGAMEEMVQRFWFNHVQPRIAPDCKPVANRREWKRLGHGRQGAGSEAVGSDAGR